MTNILYLDHINAKKFFLKQESYVNLRLPPYIKFEQLLNELDLLLQKKKELNNIKKPISKKNKRDKKETNEPKDLKDVNYKLFHNKNGKYDWRPFELIHPLLYIDLVNSITQEVNWDAIKKRFKYIDTISIVECMSLPVVSDGMKPSNKNQIIEWWLNIEQKSIELSMEFEYLYHTDISNCYGSIYTHSIPWALHSKKTSKECQNNKDLIGNLIDKSIREMNYGQTNGIPQGSVLMDFIAEIVLKYADLMLCENLNTAKLEKKDYKVLRYRDDYRIFTNRPDVADKILKILSEVLISLGMKLNSHKTICSKNVIQGSIKEDKLNWLIENNHRASLQQKLLLLHKFSLRNINSGVLHKELHGIYDAIEKRTNLSIKKFLKVSTFTAMQTKFDLQKEITQLILINELNTCWKRWKHKRDKFLKKENILVLLSIIVDIAHHNTRVYPITSAIISQLIGFIEETKQREFITKMMKKFFSVPNTGYMQIWLQRAIIPYQKNLQNDLFNFEEDICLLVNGDKNKVIWNNEWLNDKAKKIFKDNSIVDEKVRESLSSVIKPMELPDFEENSL